MFKTASRFGGLLSNLQPSRARLRPGGLLQQCSLRSFTLASSPTHERERTEVRVGGSGTVGLDVWRPRALHKGGNESLLVYLPSGPLFASESNSRQSSGLLQSVLEALPTTNLASINYRLSTPGLGSNISTQTSAFDMYPQPIHDVSVAFSYLLSAILPSLSLAPEQPHLTLVGSHIGGALASMLALTHPSEIDTVYAIEPMTDWVILDELAQAKAQEEDPPSRRKAPKQAEKELVAQAAKKLIDIRTKLFRSPSAYFDAFASPTLFLRAPGRDTPRNHAEALGFVADEAENEDWVSSDEYEKAHRMSNLDEGSNASPPTGSDASKSDRLNRQPADSSPSPAFYGPYDDDYPHTSSTTSTPPPLSLGLRQVKRRKVLRRWPPTYSSYTIAPLPPYFNIILAPPTPSVDTADASTQAERGLHALLHAQGTEFTELLKRACFFERESGVAEKRVRVREVECGKVTGAEIASWLQQSSHKSSS